MADSIESYLCALYGPNPDGGLWVGGHATKFGKAFLPTAAQAAAQATRLNGLNGAGVYHRGTTLQAAPEKGRGLEKDSAAVYFYAVDADVAGPGHKAPDLPPDRAAVDELMAASGFPPPTTWVASGGGFYPQWWFGEPIDVRHPDDLARIDDAFGRLQNHLFMVWADRGWKLDPTADLARVWRLPGTTNRKIPAAPAPVTWEGDSGRRYHLDDLLVCATRSKPAAPTWVSGSGAAPGTTPWERSRALAEVAKWSSTVCRAAHEAGQFNVTLNTAALRIGHFVPAIGTFEQARDMLAERCAVIWGSADGNDLATIESGLKAGMNDPYRVIEDIAAATGLVAPPGFTAVPSTDLDAVLAQLKEIFDADERKRVAREHVRAVAGVLAATVLQEWRDRIKHVAGLTYGDFDALVAEAKRRRKTERVTAAAAAASTTGEAVQLPKPDAPMRVARELLARDPGTHRRYWRDDFYQWTGSHWRTVHPSTIRTWVYRETEHAVYVVEGKDGPETKNWDPSTHKVNQVIDALAHGVLYRPAEDDHEPCVALSNGVLDLATGQLLEHDPARFNLASLPFAYDPAAACPRWLAFLDEVLSGDSAQFLQEWAGYLVSGRRDHHKIASLVGASRSGKGTVARVLTALLGPENVTGPVLASLTGNFGLEPLLGRSLAIFGDVKWTARGVPDATELLKTISGDDTSSVARKNRSAWEGYLPTRFMTLSNDTPSFTDASGALAGRMIHVHFTKSFAGRENINLSSELLAELPGILLWALEGLRRLDAQGRFTVPAASVAIDEEVRLAAAPHAVFAEQVCQLNPTARVELDTMWAAWVAWCNREGATPGNKRWFVRSLKSALPGVATDRRDVAGVKVKYVLGLAVRGPLPPHVELGPHPATL